MQPGRALYTRFTMIKMYGHFQSILLDSLISTVQQMDSCTAAEYMWLYQRMQGSDIHDKHYDCTIDLQPQSHMYWYHILY